MLVNVAMRVPKTERVSARRSGLSAKEPSLTTLAAISPATVEDCGATKFSKSILNSCELPAKAEASWISDLSVSVGYLVFMTIKPEKLKA